MFDDLVKPTKIPIEELIERCPYCGSYEFSESERKPMIDDKWTQKIRCDVCLKLWTLVYNEDQSPSHILLDENRRDKT